MEWALYVFLASVTLLVCGLIHRNRTNHDKKALQDEIDRDFAEEFQMNQRGDLTDKGMEDMLDWIEELDQEEKMEGLEELRDASSDSAQE